MMKHFYRILFMLTLLWVGATGAKAQTVKIVFYPTADSETSTGSVILFGTGTYSYSMTSAELYATCGNKSNTYFLISITKDGTEHIIRPNDKWNDPKVPVNASSAYDVPGDGTVSSTNTKRFLLANNAGSAAETIDKTPTAKYTFTISNVATDYNSCKIQITKADYNDADYAYYLVSSELNGTGATHQNRFRLIPSRKRDGGELSSTLFTINFKKDEIEKILKENGKSNTTSIRYHIEKANGTAYRPWSDNYTLGYTTASTTKDNIQFDTYNNPNGTNSSYEFLLDLSQGVSYTWELDASIKSEDQDNPVKYPLTMCINKANLKQNTQYSILGNFQDAAAQVQMDPTNPAYYTKMTRYIYYHNDAGIPVSVASDAEVTGSTVGSMSATINGKAINNVDSVVYKVTVARPTKGWGQLYLIATETSNLDGNTWNTNDYYKWNNATIRPEVQTYGSDREGGIQMNGMDATALRGGLFLASGISTTSTTDLSLNYSQSINPQVTSQYSNAKSYTFSINATTSTYRIVFSENEMYIMGPGIASSNTGVTTSSYNNNTLTVNKLKLTWDDENQCYKFLDSNGKETSITLNNSDNNNGFRFSYGGDFSSQPWFGEDNNVPTDLRKTGKENIAAKTADTYKGVGDNNDTQYVNYVQQGTETSIYDTNSDIKYQLPSTTSGGTTSDAIIRLYVVHEGGESYYFYTIRKKITFDQCAYTDYKLGTETLLTTDYYRLFSDYHAYKKPDFVDVYTLSKIEEKTATFTKLETEYIPANTGVLLILHGADKGVNGKKRVSLTLGDYATSINATVEDKGMLTPQYEDVILPAKSSDGNYNLIMVNHSEEYNGEKTNQDWKVKGLTFYTPTASNETGRSYAYLKYDKDISRQAQAKAMNLSETSDENTLVIPIDVDGFTTSIKGLNTATAQENVYYNLQGARISKPTQKGLYIMNGKKVIIK